MSRSLATQGTHLHDQPDDHITVFSLRNWGKLRGEVLTTEQVYIHGKVGRL